MPPTTNVLTDKEQDVLRALEHAANFHMPCPSTTDLKKMLGHKTASVAHYSMGALQAKGYIRIERGDHWRIVTILATGKSTAKTSGHARRDTPNALKHRQTRDLLRPESEVRGAILDAVVREGRNLRHFPIQGWLAEHAEAYGKPLVSGSAMVGGMEAQP